MEKKVKFSAEDNGLSSMINRIKRDTSELFQGLASEATQYSKSGKEQLNYLNEQIKLLQQRNKLETEERKLQAQSQRDLGITSATTTSQKLKTQETFKSQMKDIQKGQTESDLQIKYLKEIVETIKQTSKEEIISDRETVEEQIQSLTSGRAEGLSVEERLKLSLQQMMIGDVNEGERDQTVRYNKGLKKIGGTANTLGQLGASKNEIFAAAAIAGMVPIIGSGLSSLINKAITEGDQLQKSRFQLGATTGYRGDIGSLADIGITKTESAQFATRLAKTRGYGEFTGEGGLRRSTRGLMATMRNYGLDEDTIMRMAQIQGFDKNRRDTFGDIQNFKYIMEESGRFKGGDFSQMTKLLEVQNDIIRDQTAVLETGNTNATTRAMTAVMSLGGSFASKGRTGARYESLNQALRDPQNDFKQALMYSSLRELSPNASMFELQELQEQGILAETEKGSLINRVMEQIMGGSGSKEMKMQQVKTFFGLSANQTRQMVENYDPEKFETFVQDKYSKYGIDKSEALAEGSRDTGVIDRMTAETSDAFAEVGVKAINAFDTGLSYLTDYIQDGTIPAFKKLTKAIDDVTEANQRQYEEKLDIAKKIREDKDASYSAKQGARRIVNESVYGPGFGAMK